MTDTEILKLWARVRAELVGQFPEFRGALKSATISLHDRTAPGRYWAWVRRRDGAILGTVYLNLPEIRRLGAGAQRYLVEESIRHELAHICSQDVDTGVRFRRTMRAFGARSVHNRTCRRRTNWKYERYEMLTPTLRAGRTNAERVRA